MNDEELIKETMMLDYSQLVMHNVYMIKENKKLHSIIKEAREYIKLVATDHNIMNNNEIIYTQMQYEEIENLLEILDKENKE